MYSWKGEFGDALAGARFLVTGATGFIGRHLCHALNSLGAEVHGMARSPAVLKSVDRLWLADLLDLERVKAVLLEVRPQVVYHLAAMVTARQDRDLVLPMLRTNLLGTAHLLLALSEVQCHRVVIAGSAEERSLENGVPSSPYAAAKLAATHYALLFHRLYQVPVSVARLFMTYGPGQGAGKLVPYVIQNLLAGKSPRVESAERVCDFVYVFDVVRGLVLAGSQPGIEGKIVDLGTGTGLAIREIVEMLAAITGSATVPILLTEEGRLGEEHHVAKCDALHGLLAWEPRWSLRDGLTETVAWYRAAGGVSNEKS